MKTSRRAATIGGALLLALLLIAGPAASNAAAACPCSLWSDATVPANPIGTDSNSIELGVKFQPEVDGTITALRFYKGATNTGTHVGNLWTAAGALLASVTFQGETESGWQQASLSTPVVVTAGTTYVASYHAPGGNYSFDSAYFETAFVNGPLRAPSSSESGGNGVFLYGLGGFPVDSFNATNYWVDVVFSDTPADTTAPTVTAVSPLDGTTGVDTGVQPTATFSEPMDATTITTSTVQLSGPGGAIPASVSYDEPTSSVTLAPTSALATSTTYTMTVQGGASGVSDAAGNRLAADRTWSFTTAAPADTTPPTISAISVTSTAAGVATVSWTTNEPSTSRVDYGTAPASLTQNVSDATLVTAHSIQISGLTPGATYHYRVTSVDGAGNSTTSPAPPAAPASFMVPLVKSPSTVVMEEGSVRSGSAGVAGLAAQDSSYFRTNSTRPLLGLLGVPASSWHGRITGVPRTLTSLRVTYSGFNSRSCSQGLYIYRWTTGSWVQLDVRSVSTTEVQIDRTPSGTASNFVSSGGEVRVRVRSTSSSTFNTAANLMQITAS